MLLHAELSYFTISKAARPTVELSINMVGWCLQYHGASITCLISSRSIIYRKFGFAKLTKLSGNCAVISQGREGGDEVGCG